jgi:hypothetical protein
MEVIGKRGYPHPPANIAVHKTLGRHCLCAYWPFIISPLPFVPSILLLAKVPKSIPSSPSSLSHSTLQRSLPTHCPAKCPSHCPLSTKSPLSNHSHSSSQFFTHIRHWPPSSRNVISYPLLFIISSLNSPKNEHGLVRGTELSPL